MARAARIPRQLTKTPFSLHDARHAGLTPSALKGKTWRRIGRELYCWSGLTPDPRTVLLAWQRLLPRDVVFAGASAAWLHGLDLAPLDPVEVIAPPSSGTRSQAGLRVRRSTLNGKDVVSLRGLRATALHRTLTDLCIQSPPVEALVALDMALRANLIDREKLLRHCDSITGRAGAGRLRRLAVEAAPAESPMETRLRWILIQAGLPRPDVQVDLRDKYKRFVGRVDLYYPAARLALEYDGENHRDRMIEDNQRQNLILDAGYRLLRFTAVDIYRRADAVAALVRGSLNAPRHSNKAHR